MATKDQIQEAADNSPENAWNESTEGAAANSEWGTEVESESQIILETEGEGFIATFLEMDKPNANGIIQVHVEKVYDLNEQWLGDAMFINATRDLVNKLKKVPSGAQIRVEWTSSMRTSNDPKMSPMRVYRLQWR